MMKVEALPVLPFPPALFAMMTQYLFMNIAVGGADGGREPIASVHFFNIFRVNYHIQI
jgi:hypothetical protein